MSLITIFASVGFARAGQLAVIIRICHVVHHAGNPLTTRSQLHSIELLLIVFIFVPLTNASCFQFHVVFSVVLVHLFVVVLSEMSSASNTTAPVCVFTLVTGADVKYPASLTRSDTLSHGWIAVPRVVSIDEILSYTAF